MDKRATGPGRMVPPMFLGVAVLLMLAIDRVLPAKEIFRSPLSYYGAILVAVGLWLVFSVRAMFRRAGTTIKPFEESSTLVVDGPFRLTRNPIYLGMVLALVGFGVLLGSLTPFLVVPAFAFLIDQSFIQAEEAMLARKFGKQFEDYKRRVRRWL